MTALRSLWPERGELHYAVPNPDAVRTAAAELICDES
jgi:hypothetical protein